MPKRIKQRRPTDVSQTAYLLVQESTKEPEAKPKRKKKNTPASVSRYMTAIGRKGGKVSGKRRMTNLTAEERSRIAMEAAKARWHKEKS